MAIGFIVFLHAETLSSGKMEQIEEKTESFHTLTLPNGLRIIIQPTASQVVYAGLAVDAGTRDELPDEGGLAHLVEHLLFKGTARRRACHVACRMESVGGELNAYTDKEETVVYAAFLRPHLQRAVELLADVVFHSTFPDHEVEREVGVVLDEIDSYLDTPSELIFDDFEAQLFAGHPLGRNVLGTPQQLQTYGAAHARTFTARHYRPERTVFFVRGGVDPREVERLARRYLSDLPRREEATSLLRTPPLPSQPSRQTQHRDTHQAHVLLGGPGYPGRHPQRTALFLLHNLLGGPGMNSRLNVALRERRGLVYTVESNLSTYTDAGLFSIYFGCDTHDVERCLRLVRTELRRLTDRRLTPSQLAAAQRQLIGQLGMAADNSENQALGLGKTYLHYGHCETLADVARRIDALTPDLLLQVAGELFADNGLSTLVYL